MPQEHGKRDGPISDRRLFEETPQTGGHSAGDKRVIVPPKVDPGFGVSYELVDDVLADREMAFAKTFFANRIAGRIKKTVWTLARGAEFLQALPGLMHDLRATGCVAGLSEFGWQLGNGLKQG